jgi:hypothetical protein
MRVILKGCKRCGGDLIPDHWDWDDEMLVCVQCGHAIDVTSKPPMSASIRTRRLPIETGSRRVTRSEARV